MTAREGVIRALSESEGRTAVEVKIILSYMSQDGKRIFAALKMSHLISLLEELIREGVVREEERWGNDGNLFFLVSQRAQAGVNSIS